MRKLSHTQLDLFVISAGPVALTDTERRMAVTLLQTLLTEALAATITNPTVPTAQEVGNE
jgi:hypothetical protein